MEKINLTQVTSHIGATISASENLPFKKLPSVKADKGEVPCSVKLILDLKDKQLYFEFYARDKNERELYYFGTNQAASAQIFLVRTLKDLKYLLGTALNDCFLALEKNNMQTTELYSILQQLQAARLYIQTKKNKKGYLAPDKWRKVDGCDVVFDKEKTLFLMAGKEISAEKLIRESQNLNPKDKIVALIPVVIFSDDSEVYLNEHPDYHTLVRKSLKLEGEGKNDNQQSKPKNLDKRVCHLCLNEVFGVASNTYLSNLSRTGLNKIFTTTTVNSARDIQKSGYEDSYAVCQKCYGQLSRGERFISNELSARIAGERVFILPEGLQKHFETYKQFPDIKEDVDFVFRAKDAKQWYEEAIEETENQLFTGGYTINLIFYRTDGTCINILDTLEDVPPFRLVEVMHRFGEWKQRMNAYTKSSMTLGKIYKVIPVRSDKKGKQLNISRVLDLYKALLLGHVRNPYSLFEYATEALEKGLSPNEQQKSIYKNLLYKENNDFYIHDTVMTYLTLMHVLQEFNLLTKPIFQEGVRVLEQTFGNKEVAESLKKMEDFLEDQGFCTEAKGLFFLGALIHRVAVIQYVKGHKSKPILKKINFQGINSREILRLSMDVVEKLNQYQRMTSFSEALMSKYFIYYGDVKSGFKLDELKNVFYLLSGYAYMVGNKIPDASQTEERILEGMGTGDDNEIEGQD